jgi:serine/threonine-protein kinase
VPGYRIDRVLGEGGMGVVYKARRESDGAVVALKTIAPAIAGTEGTIARFLREASVLRQLDHPNIVRFENLGHSGGHLYFAMEFVPGLDADGLLKKQGKPLAVGLAAGLVCQTLDALAYAHALGIVHRDIKPRNLLVARQGKRPVVKLTDFGLARIYLTSPLSGLTITGHIAGTSGFMAPEQITDFRKVRPAADQYATGALLYFLLTGKKVYDFPREIQNQLLMSLQDKPISIRARREDIPSALAAIVDRALERSPGDRFPDVGAMREALKPFAASSAL